MKYLFAILVLSMMAAACSDETKTCDQTLIANLGMNFKKDTLQGYIDIDTAWPKVVMWALAPDGTKLDSILKRVQTSSAFVALDPTRDSSRYYLQLDSTTIPDTLTFRYSRKANFVSAGCGFATFFTLDTVLCTFHTIDSLHINFKEINSTNETNVSLITIAR
jgi:hypothetical protein